jgi:hypothetical protein
MTSAGAMWKRFRKGAGKARTIPRRQCQDHVEVAREPRLAIHNRRYRAGNHVREAEFVGWRDEEPEQIRRLHDGRSPGLRR